jgi:uncharacterized protein YndB with AHSA1/START domain
MKIDLTRQIDASPEMVWSVITDFACYKEWNPFVIDCDAKLEPGAPISMRVRLGPREISQVETVSSVVEHMLFEYRMKPIKPFLYSYRQHHVTSNGMGGTTYRSYFELNGWLSGLTDLSVGKHLRHGFESMTDALKQRSESLASGSSSG